MIILIATISIACLLTASVLKVKKNTNKRIEVKQLYINSCYTWATCNKIIDKKYGDYNDAR